MICLIPLQILSKNEKAGRMCPWKTSKAPAMQGTQKMPATCSVMRRTWYGHVRLIPRRLWQSKLNAGGNPSLWLHGWSHPFHLQALDALMNISRLNDGQGFLHFISSHGHHDQLYKLLSLVRALQVLQSWLPICMVSFKVCSTCFTWVILFVTAHTCTYIYIYIHMRAHLGNLNTATGKGHRQPKSQRRHRASNQSPRQARQNPSARCCVWQSA